MRIVRILLVAGLVLAASASPALAWPAGAPGIALADAAVMPGGPEPTGTTTGNDVTLAWTAVHVATAPTDYVIRRYTGSGTLDSIGGTCAGTVTATACVDSGVPDGTWRYSVTPVKASWTGDEGPLSEPVTVDTTDPSVDIDHPASGATYDDGDWDAGCGSSICGTASDDGGLAIVEISIRRDATGLYWDGAAFSSASELFLTATGTTSWSLAFPASNFPTDGDYTVAARATDTTGHSGTALATFAILNDVVAPALTALEMLDANGNGRVDRVVVTFDEPIASSTDTAPWTLANVPSGGTLSSVSTTGSQATLSIAEGVGAPTTAVGSFTVALTASGTGIRDAAGNQASFAALAPDDKAAPARTLMEMFDVDTDGKVDRVVVTFSESLAAYGAGTAPWTLANVPSNGTLSAVAGAGAAVTLTITEGAGAASTGVGTFTVALSSNPTGVRDGASNLSSFAAVAPTDKAGPVAVGITDTNGSVDGQIQAGDSMSIAFSEGLASVPASVPITMADPSGGGNDTISINGVSSGARNLGSNAYVNGNNSSFSFASSTAALAGDGSILVVTVAGSCSGTCGGNIGTATVAATLSFAAASTLSDPSGNMAVSNVINVSIRLF